MCVMGFKCWVCNSETLFSSNKSFVIFIKNFLTQYDPSIETNPDNGF